MMQLMSCSSIAEDEKITYFGGKIKNPKGSYVYFSQGKKKLDSARLDSNNKFFFKIDSLELGLYTFNHGAEFQYLYLEPQDSLLLYLNTWDFDESLIFSGKGSAKNNYLINLYLQQERTENNFKPNYKLNEEEFSKLIENGIKGQLENYNEFLETQEEAPSPFFDKLAKTGIYYPYYYFKEHYVYGHKRALGLKDSLVVSDEFYNYRENINLDDSSLFNYGPIMAFINTYLYNLADDEKRKDPENRIFELEYLKVVNDNIQDENYKNSLLAKGVWGSLTNKYLSDEEAKKIQEFFFDHCTDDQYKSEVNISIAQKERVKSGEVMPKLTAYNVQNSEVEINSLMKNTSTVIYFWPNDLGSIELLNEKLHYLEEKHPDILFIGIERNKSEKDWKKFVQHKKLTESRQFRLAKDAENYSWFEGDMPRTIIINSKGTVENGYVFFMDSNLNYYLKNIN
jgi:peroxiredoxin